MNDFPNNFENRPLSQRETPGGSDNSTNNLTIAAAAIFAAVIVALVMFAPGNKDGTQVASNDSAGAITMPGNAYNRPDMNRPATTAEPAK